MKCEIFISSSVVSLQGRINQWLANHPKVEIIFIQQSESDSETHGFGVTVSIWYKD